jgi:hypothetical protein
MLPLVSVFKKLQREIAEMIRRIVQGIPAHLLEYLGRFLKGNSLKTALQDVPKGSVDLHPGSTETNNFSEGCLFAQQLINLRHPFAD